MNDTPAQSKLFIVCSDRAGNGKTLLSRLFADYLFSLGQHVSIYDLDAPDGRLSGYFPDTSQLIDFSRTDGKVALLDTVLAKAEQTQNSLIDIPHHQLDSFVSVLQEIDFMIGAREARLDVIVLYITEQSISSVQKATSVKQALGADHFIPVRNDIDARILTDQDALGQYSELCLSSELIMPPLDHVSMTELEDGTFSFAMYLGGEETYASDDAYYQIVPFFKVMHEQFHEMMVRLDLTDLRSLGIV